jgi:hypothetical protein
MIDRFMAKPGFVFTALLGAAAVGVSPGVSLAQEGAQLTGAEIAALVTGKTIVYRSYKFLTGTGPDARVVPRTDGGFMEGSLYMRPDGSFRMRCVNVSRDGRQLLCPRLPRGDVGAWRIRGDAWCITQLVREGHEQCFAYHRHGDGYRFRQVSGPAATGDGAHFVVK